MSLNNQLVIVEFRFYADGNKNNYPQDPGIWTYALRDDITDDKKNLLSNYDGAKKIGIQGLPGTIFYLDDSTPNGIMIDHTGIYELDLRDTTVTIHSLYFDGKSLATISQTDNASLIVDALCYNKS
jgi:hypothetical protein